MTSGSILVATTAASLVLLNGCGSELIAENCDIDANALNYCSRITSNLTVGTYYVTVWGTSGKAYAVWARAGS